MDSIWDYAKEEIRKKVPEHSFRLWIEPLEMVSQQDNQVHLACPTGFFKRWVSHNYLSLIQKEMEKTCGGASHISLEVAGNNGSKDGEVRRVEEQLFLPHMTERRQVLSKFHSDFTFEQFVVGMCNNFAYNAALSLACSDHRKHDPVYLLSKTGLGKSHLSHAVGNHVLQEDSAVRVCYVTAEEFTNGMIHALRHDKIEEFKERYRRQCDVLLLEDVQFLTGKRKTQDELAYTLDALLEAKKKLIFTGTHLPGDIPKMDEKLTSLLSAGVISTIDTPDYETRVAILRKKAAAKKVDMSEDVVEYLAKQLSQNVRQLESGLIGVVAKASLLNLPIDVKLAQSVVQNIVRHYRKVTVERIQKLVCKYYKVTREELVSRSRKQAIAQPRQIAMFLARRYTDESLQAIGRHFNRYHATTLHSIGVVERLLRENSPVQKQIEFLADKVESGNI
jgi:chromosomal replication initiator protein